MFLSNILYCSPCWLQSLEPCSISEYSCLGADFAKPTVNAIPYIIVNPINVGIKSPAAPWTNTFPNVENGCIIPCVKFSIKLAILKAYFVLLEKQNMKKAK